MGDAMAMNIRRVYRDGIDSFPADVRASLARERERDDGPHDVVPEVDWVNRNGEMSITFRSKRGTVPSYTLMVTCEEWMDFQLEVTREINKSWAHSVLEE